MLKHKYLYTIMLISLVSCNLNNEQSAPVNQIGEGTNKNTNVTSMVPEIKEESTGKPIANSQSLTTDDDSASQPANVGVNIPRDHNNAPIYKQIDKGFYKNDTYTVQKGDTMFMVAYISNSTIDELEKLNNLKKPYVLSIGQVIKLGSHSQNTAVTPSVPNDNSSNNNANNGSDISSNDNSDISSNNTPEVPAKPPVATAQNTPSVPVNVSNLKWQMPTKGKITEYFSNGENGSKGINIAGSKGQSIRAVSDGRVVYAGNALRGYGNLVLIKHNNDYISAYAHNDAILVKNQQQVQAGQEIAKMGSSGTNSVKLHFELRYKGKSIDPLLVIGKK